MNKLTYFRIAALLEGMAAVAKFPVKTDLQLEFIRTQAISGMMIANFGIEATQAHSLEFKWRMTGQFLIFFIALSAILSAAVLALKDLDMFAVTILICYGILNIILVSKAADIGKNLRLAATSNFDAQSQGKA